MNRGARTAIVLVVALVMATVASYALYLAVQNMPVREVEVNTVPIVVATQDLPVGTLITVDHLKTVQWPSDNLVAGAFSSTEEVTDRGLIASIITNEPVTEVKLASRESGAGLPPSIPLGMRALSVRVNDVIGVAGFVVPGTRVDVLATVSQGQRNSMSKVVVSNVQVLTAGTRYDLEQARTGEPMPSTVVTLMVTPEEAERIALAGTEGQLVLTLRNPLDTKPTETDGIRSAALMGPAPKPPVIVQRRVARVAIQPAPEAPKTYTVEAIRAGRRGNEEVR